MQEVHTLAERLEKIETDVNEIKTALLGNKYMKEQGMVHKVENHEERLERIEKVLQNGKWLVVGLSVGTGGFLWELIKMFIK